MYRKIKITIAIFFTLIIILSSISIISYENSGNVSITNINDSGKRFTSGSVATTVNLFKNSSVKGNYKNCPVHQESHEIAYDPLNGYIYLSGYSNNLIYVINPETNSVIKCISGLSAPQDTLYDSYNHDIYVADCSSNNVSIINTTYNIVVKNIHVGFQPVGLAYDNSSKDLYVSNIAFGFNGNITVINTLNDKTIGNINVGKVPRSILYDKYNNLLYVSNEYSNNISVINASNNKIITNISLPFNSHAEALVLDRANNCIYSMERNGSVLFINPNTFQIVNSTYTLYGAWGAVYDPANSNMYIFDADSGRICIMHDNKRIGNISGIAYPVSGVQVPDYNNIYITSSSSNNLYVLNATSEKITGMVIIKDYPQKMAYDSKTGNIYITNKYADNVLIMNSSNKIIGKINVGKNPIGIVYDKFNNYVYVTNINSDNVSVINASTNIVIKSIPVGALPRNILLNPVNKNLYVLNFYSKNISIINTLDNKAEGNINLVASPLGIAFDTANDNMYITTMAQNKSIYVINSHNIINKTIYTGTSYLYGILYDSQNNLIYVSNVYNRTLCVLNPENDTFTLKIYIGARPEYGMILDTYNNFIYVMGHNNLISINTSSNRRVDSIRTGSYGSSALYINKTNTIYVANSKSGTISKIDTVCYTITFIINNVKNNVIKHIPSYFILNGHYYFPHSNKLTLSKINGTYRYIIGTYRHYNLKNPTGAINISGDNVIITADYRNYYNLDVFLEVLVLISVAFTYAIAYTYAVVKSRQKNKN